MKHLLLLLFSACIFIAQAQKISTVAGTGVQGYNGDAITATSAKLALPDGVALDKAGNIFIADTYNHRIRKVAKNGTITTIAGGSTGGYRGDKGPATSALLYYPEAVTVDTAGDIYIADFGNQVVRMINAAGIITTIAGNGTGGYSGDGGPATAAQLSGPYDVCLDTMGNVIIADWRNNVIRKVNKSGIISTVAGTGTAGYGGDGGKAKLAQLNNPYGVAVDKAGNIYIGDTYNNRIRKVSVIDSTITTFAGNGIAGSGGDNGPAISCELNNPIGIKVDTVGDVFFADALNNKVREVSALGIITTVAGAGVSGYSGDGGSPLSAKLNYPIRVSLDTSGNIFVAERDNDIIRKIGSSSDTLPVTPNQTISAFAGTGIQGYNGDNIIATSAELALADGVATDKAGNVYIADTYNNRVRKVSKNGIITTVAGNGGGGYSGDNGLATSAEMYEPEAVAVDDSGTLYIADFGNQVVRKVSPQGIITTIAGNHTGGFSGDGGQATAAELSGPYDLCIAPSGNLIIADWRNNRIRSVNKQGIISTIAGTGAAGYNGDGEKAVLAELNNPYGVTVDKVGNIYIGDSYNNRIRKISVVDSTISTFAGTGTNGNAGDGGLATAAELYSPIGVKFDASGDLVFADFDNHKIRQISTTGVITTIAGTGVAGYTGNGGNPLAAEMNHPIRVALDSAGNLYVAERNNDIIRKISGNTTLPVTLTNFTAYSSGKGVQTAWTGYDEINMSGYEVERSAKGYQFNAIGNVAAKNNGSAQNSYTLFDASPLQGDNYYRIRAISKDGTIQYSGTVLVKIGGEANIAIYPNPVTNKTIQVHINNIDAGVYQYMVYSSTGKQVAAGSYTHAGGSAVVAINAAGLAKGIYHVVFKGGKSGYTLKVLVL